MTWNDLTLKNSPPYWLADYIEIEVVGENQFRFSSVKNGQSNTLSDGEVGGLVLLSKNRHSTGEGTSWPDSSIVPRVSNEGCYTVQIVNGIEPKSGDKFSILGKAV